MPPGFSRRKSDPRIDELITEFREFREQYDKDMRGDMNAENGGKRGLVGEVRDIKQHIRTYPSITYLLATRPVPTVAVLLAIYAFMQAMWTVGLFRLAAALFGLELPEL